MQLKRYEAKSINDAMEKIKHDLGEDAVVLSTKRLKGDKRELLEVIAARDEDLVSLSQQENGEQRRDPVHTSSDVTTGIREDIGELKSLINNFLKGTNICAEMAELKDHFHTFFDLWGIRKSGKRSSHLSQAYYHLISTGMTKRQACQLIEAMQRRNGLEDLHDYDDTIIGIEDMLRDKIGGVSASMKKDKRIWALIGPTGTGKTTTLAKLAARHVCERKANVGIVTMDTYRVGATDQLRKYAHIMGVPLEIARDKASLEAVVRRLSERDVILVDTPGRSLKDESHLRQLNDVLTSVPGMGKHLVLSVTSSYDSMMNAARRFGVTGYDTFIFTKLDDAGACGTMYSLVDEMKKPVSYVTDGQNVPRDIREVEPAMLARIIMNNGYSCQQEILSH
jgi:flagellar biosynthesis protein FlhF